MGEVFRMFRVVLLLFFDGLSDIVVIVSEESEMERKIRYISERVALGAVACFWLLGVASICYLFYGV
jgi:hypothetical protein